MIRFPRFFRKGKCVHGESGATTFLVALVAALSPTRAGESKSGVKPPHSDRLMPRTGLHAHPQEPSPPSSDGKAAAAIHVLSCSRKTVESELNTRLGGAPLTLPSPCKRDGGEAAAMKLSLTILGLIVASAALAGEAPFRSRPTAARDEEACTAH